MDADLIRWLNLLRDSPGFVLSAEGGLTKVSSVPPTAGFTMIAGTTVAAAGRRIDSVFEVEANGGDLHGVYWFIQGEWFASSDDAAVQALGVSGTDIFPFDWELAVALDVDHYHGGAAPRRPHLP